MDEIVMVPVPRRYLEIVYRAMGEAGAQQSPRELAEEDTEKEAVEASESSGNGDWSPNELIRTYRESPPPIRKVLTYLADRAGQPVTGPELVREVYGAEDPKGKRKLPGALGAFGRRVKNRYGKGSWPFKARWSYEQNVMHYEMDSWTAEHIKRAISES